MTAIFVSHRTMDNDAAAALKNWLEAQGHKHFFLDFDPADGISAGVDWEQTIYHHLRQCQALLVIRTPSWHDSPWCFAEFTIARTLGKPIFVVRVKPCPGQPLLPALQEVDLTTDRGAALAKLARGLKEHGLDPRDAFDWKPNRPIYPGLSAFDEEDAAVFFGRSEENWRAVETLERLRRQGRSMPRLLQITGASGSGKSSLMRAGLLPRLRKEPGQWLVVHPFRRGSDALAALGEALAWAWREHQPSHAPSPAEVTQRLCSPAPARALLAIARDLRLAADRPEATLLLALDQAEEFLVPEAGASQVLALLRSALTTADHGIMAVATIRSDMLGAWQQHPAVRATDKEPEFAFEAFPLGPLPLDRIPEIIRGPARYVRLDIDDGLVDIIRQDIKTPDALPLLAYTLSILYREYGMGGRLTLAAYRTLGGLEGSIRRTANAAIDIHSLSAEDREALRAAFIPALVRATDAGGFVRDRALRQNLPRQADPLISKLVDARLLVTQRDEEDHEVVEIAHEALLRTWPLLSAWLAEDQNKLHLLESIRRAAQEWDDGDRREDLLIHRDGRLADAASLVREPRFALAAGSVDKIYLDACLEAQSARERARRRRIRTTIVSLGIGLCVLAGVALWATVERAAAQRAAVKAEQQQIQAQSNFLSASALLAAYVSSPYNGYADRAGLLARQALLVQEGLDNISNLLRTLQGVGTLSHTLHGHSEWVWEGTFSPDGRRVVSGSDDGTLRWWDVTTGQPSGEPWQGASGAVRRESFNLNDIRLYRPWNIFYPNPLQIDEGVRSMALSPDGRYVISGSRDGMLRLRDATTGQLLGQPWPGGGPVRSLAVSPDGRRVISGGEDHALRLWDVTTGKLLDHWGGLGNEVWGLAFRPDGRRVVSGTDDGKLRLWDVTADTGQLTGQPWQGHSKAVRGVAFSPDGRQVVSGSSDGTLRLWDATTGQPLGQPWQGHGEPVWRVAFSRDGRRVVSGSLDGTLRLWDTTTGQPLGQPWQGHSEAVRSVAFSPDGRQVVSGSEDRTLRLWNVTLGAPWQGHSEAVRSVAFSPDGRQVVSGSEDRTLRLWDAATGQPLGQPWQGHRQVVSGVAFSPDGRRVVSGSFDWTLRLWDAATGQPLGEPWRRPGGPVAGVAFSRDGRHVVSGSFGGTLRLWDAATGQPLGQPWQGHSKRVLCVAFSPDGHRVVSGGEDGMLQLWDATTGQPLGQPWQGHGEPVLGVSFSPDGRHVVSGSEDGTLRLWDAATGQPLGQPWQGHSKRVLCVAFSPDGRRVVSGGEDETLRLWDATTGQPLGEPWRGHRGVVWHIAFSRDGHQVVSGSKDGTLRLWDMDETSWRQRACHIAGRNFTWAEWRRYMGARPYVRTCDAYPVHPTVIAAWLDEAARLFNAHDAHAAQQRYQQALQAAKESPVKYDMIALYLATFEALQSHDKTHPLLPLLRAPIQEWVATQPETNRSYWKVRLAPIETGGS